MTSLAMVTGLVMAGAAPANAACPEERWLAVKGYATKIPFKGVPTYKDGPGGTITVSRTHSGTASYSVTAGTSAEVDAVFAKAKVEISKTIVKSNSTSTTHTYSHRIDSGKYGNVRYVSWGKKVYWWRKMVQRDCDVVVLRKGIIKFPRSSEGWYYWQTSS